VSSKTDTGLTTSVVQRKAGKWQYPALISTYNWLDLIFNNTEDHEKSDLKKTSALLV